ATTISARLAEAEITGPELDPVLAAPAPPWAPPQAARPTAPTTRTAVRRCILPASMYRAARPIAQGFDLGPSLHSPDMSAIAVVGTGYVGLTSAACFAELGHQVTGVDIDEAKVATLKQGRPTIYEPGLEEIMARG